MAAPPLTVVASRPHRRNRPASPVACLGDIVDPTLPRQATLLGRALAPFCSATTDANAVERARTIFMKMFEAGANNRAALAGLLSPSELQHLRGAIASALRGIDHAGACERVGALREIAHPDTWAAAASPICRDPTLILYAENEDSVMAAASPTRRVLGSHGLALFPVSRIDTVRGGVTPVQHASLIFHFYQFLPHFSGFYRKLRSSKLVLAA